MNESRSESELMTVDTARRTATTAWRVLGHLGLVDTIFNHMSIAYGGDGRKTGFVINATDRLAVDATDSGMVLVGMDGPPPGGRPIVSDGLILHRAVQEAFPGQYTAVHLHSPWTTRLSATRFDVRPITQATAEFVGDIEYVEYGGLLRMGDECIAHICDALTTGRIALLRNHGVVVGSSSTAECVYLAYYLESTAQDLLMLGACGEGVVPMSDALAAEAKQMLVADRPRVAGVLFDAFVHHFGVADV